MTWQSPVPFFLVPDAHDRLWRSHLAALQGPWNDTLSFPVGIPSGSHPGAFGVVRRYHVHEGIDLYVPDQTPVLAVERGEIVAIENFTGVQAGSPWWQETWSVLVEGKSGVVVYGEIRPHAAVRVGLGVEAGEILGAVTPVLSKDKGRPVNMLHLELHHHGTRESVAWEVGQHQPPTLLDPTPFLAGPGHEGKNPA